MHKHYLRYVCCGFSINYHCALFIPILQGCLVWTVVIIWLLQRWRISMTYMTKSIITKPRQNTTKFEWWAWVLGCIRWTVLNIICEYLLIYQLQFHINNIMSHLCILIYNIATIWLCTISGFDYDWLFIWMEMGFCVMNHSLYLFRSRRNVFV